MNTETYILGLLDQPSVVDDERVARKLRDLTISWSRYDYGGEIIESSDVNEILDRALSEGYRWCLVLPHGCVIAERWRPEHWQGPPFRQALEACMSSDEFLVAGRIVGDSKGWFGFEKRCLLVNLRMYARLDSPRFNDASAGVVELPRAEAVRERGSICRLLPAGAGDQRRPARDGWNFIASSLRAGIPVLGFDESLRSGMMDLEANAPSRVCALTPFLGQGIRSFEPQNDGCGLSEDQIDFLQMVQPQTGGARNGVFLWNIEGYADIESPDATFESPTTSLYSVAAGFKPNRILHTHGWDASTRVVFFDYSPRALEVKKYLIKHWDGEDLPEFVEHLFQVFPHPETFYQLWDNLTPDRIDRSDIEQMWQRELNAWGSAETFRNHWLAYRKLPHEFVDCNLLTDRAALLTRIRREPHAIIWWSNAFFTMYGNWFYSLEQRQQMYETWIEQVANLNPDLYIYGSDYNNVNVNSIRAGDYWHAYRSNGSDCLRPCRLYRTEVRM